LIGLRRNRLAGHREAGGNRGGDEAAPGRSASSGTRLLKNGRWSKDLRAVLSNPSGNVCLLLSDECPP
jgi:hypothetical protein